MIALDLHSLAQAAIGASLNTVVEGVTLASVAALLLRSLRQQNSATRFGVWFATLLAIAALPLFTGSGSRGASGGEPLVLTFSSSWALGILVAWAITAVLLVARLAVSLAHVHRLRQNAREIAAATLDPAASPLRPPQSAAFGFSSG
jgi:hypothetical protein